MSLLSSISPRACSGGRHVHRGPDQRPFDGPQHIADLESVRIENGSFDLLFAGPIDPGQAPVHDEDLAELPDHDVLGLEVAVDDPPAVGVADGVDHLEEDAQQSGPADRGLLGTGRDLLQERLEACLRICFMTSIGSPPSGVRERSCTGTMPGCSS